MVGEILGVLFYIVGGVAFAYFVFWCGFSSIQERKSFTKEVQAKFLRVDIQKGYNNHYNYRAIFEFEKNGRKQELSAMEDLGTSKPKQFQEGQMYTVYVNPQNPRMFRCKKGVYTIGYVIVTLFGIFLLISTIGFWTAKIIEQIQYIN